MAAIAKPLPGPDLELAGEPPLPPGGVPLEPVSVAIRAYRDGASSAEELIATVDRHGVELEAAIAARALEDYTQFLWTVERLVVLHDRLSARFASWVWIRRFPEASDAQPRELTIVSPRGSEIPVTSLLHALGQLDVDERLAAAGKPLLAARLNRLLGEEEAAEVLALVRPAETR